VEEPQHHEVVVPIEVFLAAVAEPLALLPEVTPTRAALLANRLVARDAQSDPNALDAFEVRWRIAVLVSHAAAHN